MPDGRRTTCQDCGKHSDTVGPISWRGYCGKCGPARAHAAADDLHYHRGPKFERWRAQLAASVGGVLLDELETKA
jgi:hypothetical protein